MCVCVASPRHTTSSLTNTDCSIKNPPEPTLFPFYFVYMMPIFFLCFVSFKLFIKMQRIFFFFCSPHSLIPLQSPNFPPLHLRIISTCEAFASLSSSVFSLIPRRKGRGRSRGWGVLLRSSCFSAGGKKKIQISLLQ